MITTAVAIVVIAATELSVSWNNISGVSDLGSAGQLIPFTLGIMVFVHVLWEYWNKEPAPPGDVQFPVSHSLALGEYGFPVDNRFSLPGYAPNSASSLDNVNTPPAVYGGYGGFGGAGRAGYR